MWPCIEFAATAASHANAHTIDILTPRQQWFRQSPAMLEASHVSQVVNPTPTPSQEAVESRLCARDPRRSPRAAEPRIVAMMNQKGGVGKTTTTVNLGAALAEAGQRVLLIDLDPQAHLSLHVGVDPDALERSAYHLLTDPAQEASAVIQRVSERISVLPAEVNLAGVESELAQHAVAGHAQHVLRWSKNKLPSRCYSPQQNCQFKVKPQPRTLPNQKLEIRN